MISPIEKGSSTLKAVETVCFLLVQLHASGFPQNLVMINSAQYSRSLLTHSHFIIISAQSIGWNRSNEMPAFRKNQNLFTFTSIVE